MRTIALAAMALIALLLAGSDTRADGPWCAYYRTGGTNCGFYSFEQCIATISGAGGYCGQNSNYSRRGRD